MECLHVAPSLRLASSSEESQLPHATSIGHDFDATATTSPEIEKTCERRNMAGEELVMIWKRDQQVREAVGRRNNQDAVELRWCGMAGV